MLKDYLIVEKSALPDYFLKVVEARRLLESGACQQVSGACEQVGITAEAGSWQQALTALVTAVFGVLALVGVTTDPTTKGLGDSAQALTYHKPKDDREG